MWLGSRYSQLILREVQAIGAVGDGVPTAYKRRRDSRQFTVSEAEALNESKVYKSRQAPLVSSSFSFPTHLHLTKRHS